MITEAEDETLREKLKQRLGPLLEPGAAPDWKSSADGQAWTKFSSDSRPDPTELSNYLVDLACGDVSDGYIIKGIAGSLSGAKNYTYAKLTAAKLIDTETCPAAKHLSEETLADLKVFAAR